MIANIIAVGILVLCISGAVGYMIRRHNISAKTGCPSCCGCSACHGNYCRTEKKKN